jgi:hypothetical protein
MQSMLVQCIREAGLVDEETCNADADDWHSWARYESDNRTKILAFCFLNLMSHAYNQPPLLLADEINLPLPSSNEEWSASTEEWRCLYRSRDLLNHSTIRFKDGLNELITNSINSAPLRPAPSALGSYILLHGLLQKVLVMRQACLFSINPSRSLPTAELEAIE